MTAAATRSKLVGAARLLASDKPGEAFAAIAALDRLLPEGQTLAGVVEAALTARENKPVPRYARARPVPPSPAHWGQADCCLGVLDLTDWERSFLATIRRKSSISDKQQGVLAPLYERALESIA